VFRSAADDKAYDALLERTQRAFKVAAASLWPRRRRTIAPYSGRHAFAARAKAAYPPEEVAALMGHGVDETAFMHYGRRSRKASGGHSWPLPKADPRDVARVRQAYAKSLEALAKAHEDADPGPDRILEQEPEDCLVPRP
jgi:hypothetical protein